MAVGSGQTRLVVLRGNSGSGKSTVSTVQQTIGLIAADAQLPQRPGPLMAGGITYDNAPPDDPSGRMRT